MQFLFKLNIYLEISTKFLPQTLIFQSLYLCNPMSWTFDILNFCQIIFIKGLHDQVAKIKRFKIFSLSNMFFHERCYTAFITAIALAIRKKTVIFSFLW